MEEFLGHKYPKGNKLRSFEKKDNSNYKSSDEAKTIEHGILQWDTHHNYFSLLFLYKTKTHIKKFQWLKSIQIWHNNRQTLVQQHF